MITIIGKRGCVYCSAAEGLLQRRGIAFRKLDVSDHESEGLISVSGMKSLPVIYSGDELIGGYDQLQEYVRGL
jgi:glutaredoxin